MATDGVKIIDGDLARDVYDGIMDLYDSGAKVDVIRREVPFRREDYGPDSDFYYEIFVTAYALAFWEIGELTPSVLEEMKSVIAKGVGIKVWSDEVGPPEGRKRQKELERLVKKISIPNLKIRKRKKYKIVKNLYFQPDDVISFRLSDGGFRAMICAKVTQQRGQCSYDLVPTTYTGNLKPSISDIFDSAILGRRIDCGYDAPSALSIQPGVDKIWNHCKVTKPFIFGLPYELVSHTDMIEMKGNFERIGELKIRDSFKKDGSYGYISSFTDIQEKFSDLEAHLLIWGLEKFPVRLLCDV